VAAHELTALEFLKVVRDDWRVPLHSREGNCVSPASGSEMRRWLEKGSVLVNGTYPKPQDIVTYPITQLVLNAKSKHKCTLVEVENLISKRDIAKYLESLESVTLEWQGPAEEPKEGTLTIGNETIVFDIIGREPGGEQVTYKCRMRAKKEPK
jgi:hypothetical protein